MSEIIDRKSSIKSFNRSLKKTNNSSKFYSKSLTLLIRILELVQQGTIAADIARYLQMKKSHVSYYIKKAKNMGYVKRATRDAFVFNELTQAGKTFLDQYDNNNTPSPSSCVRLRAENIRFRAPVVRMPNIPVDWEKIQRHNWAQYKSRIDSVTIMLNMGRVPVLEFLPTPLDGDDPFEIFVTMVFECVNVILELNDKMGLRVGPLQLGSRGEWLVYDPNARSFCKINGQVTYEGIGKVNASAPKRIGEIEFFDPRALLDYLMMPERLRNIEAIVQNMESKLEKFLSRQLGRGI